MQLTWDAVGERRYETGVSHGVLFVRANDGSYPEGVAWNGLTTVTESPSGGEATAVYADNIQYLNLVSKEIFGATIEALTYPDEFEACDGTAEIIDGVTVGQQNRSTFGFSYETLVGNDVAGTDLGTKLHLVYGALAKPSEKARATVNDTPEATPFSWEVTTTPVPVTGYKDSATLVIDSTKVSPAAYAAIIAVVYGTAGQDARLPLPDEVKTIISGAGSDVVIAPAAPTIAANVITVPTVAGAQWYINDKKVANGAQPAAITADVIARVEPLAGYKFAPTYDNTFQMKHT
jgi:hypothetical protein